MSIERNMWVTVMIYGLRDAAQGIPAWMLSSKAAFEIENDRAKKWIGSKDFRWVCELAGFDPDFIEEAFRAGKFDNPRWYVEDRRGRDRRKQPEEVAA